MTDENLALALFTVLPIALGGVLVAFVKRGTLPHWPRVLIINSLVLMVLLSVLLFAGEVYFRFIYDSTDSLAYTKVNILWGQRHWHVNNFQMRDNVDYAPIIGTGRRRVTFLGDSFTAGHGIKNVEDRVVNRVRRANPECEVQMLARIGADTGDEIKFLNIGVTNGYQLDQVVLVYCLNDISDLMPERDQAMERLRAELASAGWLCNSSYLFNVVSHRIKAQRDPFMKDYFADVLGAYDGPLWEQQKERLKTVRDVVQSNGGRLSVIIWPFLQAVGPNYTYKGVHEKLTQYCKELNVPCLDLLPVVEGVPPSKLVVNQLDVHPNEYANKLAAQAVNDFLKKRLSEKS